MGGESTNGTLVYAVVEVYSVDMSLMRVERVTVPGAVLHTESAGDGPALLLISGGGGDAGMYEQVVPTLAHHYTVLTYDRRGNSRSALTDPDAPIAFDVQADDAVAVLDHYGFERAHIFGSSGGAVIGLDLLARHHERVATLVAHEPPLVSSLPANSPEENELRVLVHLARASTLRAYAAFGAMTMTNPPALLRSPAGQLLVAGASAVGLTFGGLVHRITGAEPGSMSRQLGNAEQVMRRELPMIFAYQLDETALGRLHTPWRLAVGEQSVGKPYYRPALVLAERLGVPCEVFPGGHVSYIEDPTAFTAALQRVLGELSA